MRALNVAEMKEVSGSGFIGDLYSFTYNGFSSTEESSAVLGLAVGVTIGATLLRNPGWILGMGVIAVWTGFDILKSFNTVLHEEITPS